MKGSRFFLQKGFQSQELHFMVLSKIPLVTACQTIERLETERDHQRHNDVVTQSAVVKL